MIYELKCFSSQRSVSDFDGLIARSKVIEVTDEQNQTIGSGNVIEKVVGMVCLRGFSR